MTLRGMQISVLETGTKAKQLVDNKAVTEFINMRKFMTTQSIVTSILTRLLVILKTESIAVSQLEPFQTL